MSFCAIVIAFCPKKKRVFRTVFRSINDLSFHLLVIIVIHFRIASNTKLRFASVLTFLT